MKIELINLQNTDTGAHVKVLANDKEVGILYLSHEELDAFLDLIRYGARNSSTEFINSVFNEETDYDDEDSDYNS